MQLQLGPYENITIPQQQTKKFVNETADSPQDLACLYFVGAVIEQAVRYR